MFPACSLSSFVIVWPLLIERSNIFPPLFSWFLYQCSTKVALPHCHKDTWWLHKTFSFLRTCFLFRCLCMTLNERLYRFVFLFLAFLSYNASTHPGIFQQPFFLCLFVAGSSFAVWPSACFKHFFFPCNIHPFFFLDLLKSFYFIFFTTVKLFSVCST